MTGIFRQEWEDDEGLKEEWYMRDLINILKYMKKYPIKSYYYTTMQLDRVWDSISDITALRIYIRDWFYHIKYMVKEKHKLNKSIRDAVKLAKKINNSYVYVQEREEGWYPRIAINLRVKENANIDEYIEEQEIIDEFEQKHCNINLTQWDYDPISELTEEEKENDKQLKESFFELIKDKDCRVIYRRGI